MFAELRIAETAWKRLLELSFAICVASAIVIESQWAIKRVSCEDVKTLSASIPLAAIKVFPTQNANSSLTASTFLYGFVLLQKADKNKQRWRQFGGKSRH